MKYYSVYRTVNTTFVGRKRKNGSPMGTVTSSFRNVGTDRNVRDEIKQVRKVSGVVPTWSIFKDRLGNTIEKCTFEWVEGPALVRMTDTFWINKGKRY